MKGNPDEVVPFALVELCWLDVSEPLRYPARRRFGTTGFREADGPDGLFSVYIVLLQGEPAPGGTQLARLFALAEQMQDRLPAVGERFVLTAGTTPVARCLGIARGTDRPESPAPG